MSHLSLQLLRPARAAGLILALGLFSSVACQAQSRGFPAQAQYCEMTSHALPAAATAVLNGKQATLSAALVIRDENNRIVVNSYLPQKFAGMCIQGPGGGLEKVWILTQEQAKAARQAAKEQSKMKAAP